MWWSSYTTRLDVTEAVTPLMLCGICLLCSCEGSTRSGAVCLSAALETPALLRSA